jgi:hypothetical protein
MQNPTPDDYTDAGVIVSLECQTGALPSGYDGHAFCITQGCTCVCHGETH